MLILIKHKIYIFKVNLIFLYFVRWICEKYDGLRAMWHPGRKQFFSRKGKQLVLPDWLRESMPDLPLDGEFWYISSFFFSFFSLPSLKKLAFFSPLFLTFILKKTVWKRNTYYGSNTCLSMKFLENPPFFYIS